MSIVFVQKWKNVCSLQYDRHQLLQHKHLTLQQLGYCGAQNCTYMNVVSARDMVM